MPRHVPTGPLDGFRPAVRDWFRAAFAEPTRPQVHAWPPIARRESVLLLAPTGTGKTLAAFLGCLDRLMFEPVPDRKSRCRVVYVSPLKALAVDVERNLRVPLAGIAREAARRGDAHHLPAVAVRTGDTEPRERARFRRSPADILVTTPESLYLLLTSDAREVLRSVDTVIVDEIHALVPTKRGAHLALSLERLESMVGRPLQRIGLSATQRPLDEIARFLGGAADSGGAGPMGAVPSPADALHDEGATDPTRWRSVTVLDAGTKKALELRIEVPVEDMARLGELVQADGAGAQDPARASIWTAIHPRLLELVRAHRTTLVFVNARRTAERLAAALNALAGEELVLAHHGSVAREQRLQIEERLKQGRIRGLVATSSLELGIDMGAIDLVVQIQAPPSVAHGMQRIGRGGHGVGIPSRGVVFPKYRSDLVACAAVSEAMHEGDVEPSRYPRNPLDVLAQQLVAMASMEPWNTDTMLSTVRRAAPFAQLGQGLFESVLDMLAGRYSSDDFAALRPRIVWDRLKNKIAARDGARHVAVVNGGTIPDRGLYGVYLAGAGKRSARVGELDEEMVFESRVGETFLLGASSWRIEEITHDRVHVSPAPGVPGKMPFWHGDGPGRPPELGRRIGRLVRELRELPFGAASQRLQRMHDLDRRAAENLLRYLEDQQAATGAVPDDRTVVVERTRDELGDWRVCVLSPLGGRVLAPWAMAVQALVQEKRGVDVETMWTDDGFVVRFPESDEPPPVSLLVPRAEDAERLLLAQLGGTALFAGRFRESAARALLLPRRAPGRRTALWQQRRRASDLLAVASRHPSFPLILETYRECLRDVFDVPGLLEALRDAGSGALRVVAADPPVPSPFAASVMFGLVGNYIYEGDAPLAECRAQALAVDHAQLRELLGEAELRELLDPDVVRELAAELQHLDGHAPPHGPDGLHDLLLRLGDLGASEIRARAGDAQTWLRDLVADHRAVPVRVRRKTRYVPAELAARYRDGLGIALPPGLPKALLAPVPDALSEIALRFARTHVPFTTREFADRYALEHARAEEVLRALAATGRVVEGAFRPGGTLDEWCDPEVLRTLRRRSLARARRDVEPVEPAVLGRLALRWHGIATGRSGLDALLDAVERLQGAPLPASIFESEILSARVEGFTPATLDALAAAGEVVWCGVGPLGEHDGKIALYLTDHLPRLWRPPPQTDAQSEREQRIVEFLRGAGACFFDAIHAAAGGGFPAQTVDALWSLVWRGIATNDIFHPLRAYVGSGHAPRGRRVPKHGTAFRSRRLVPPSAGGRWTLVETRVQRRATDTEWSAAAAAQLLARHPVVTRDVLAAENLPGGFAAVYDVLKAMEENGRARRGYFVAGTGAMQFSLPSVPDLLRTLRHAPDPPEVATLAATDPANPYGAALRWPGSGAVIVRGPARSTGAHVVLVNGAAAAWIGRGAHQLHVWLPDDEPERSVFARSIVGELEKLQSAPGAPREMVVQEINGVAARRHPFGRVLEEAGCTPVPEGYRLRRRASTAMPSMRAPGRHALHGPMGAEPDAQVHPHG